MPSKFDIAREVINKELPHMRVVEPEASRDAAFKQALKSTARGPDLMSLARKLSPEAFDASASRQTAGTEETSSNIVMVKVAPRVQADAQPGDEKNVLVDVAARRIVGYQG